MKLFHKRVSANHIFSLHKNVLSLIPLSEREFFCNENKDIDRETNVKPSPTNNSRLNHSYYKAKKINKLSSNKDIHFKKYNNFPSEDRNVNLNDFSKNSDTFGTLSQDFQMMTQLNEMPEEEDDVIEKDFINNIEGKTRLSINQYAYIIKEFVKRHKIGNAIDVLETRMLKDDSVRPDSYIYNLLIGACGQVGFTKKAFKLYNDMKKRGLKVTGHTYTNLFNACANSPFPAEDLKRAAHLRELMFEKKYVPNQVNYHAMIKAFGRCGDIETAFTLVDEMLENNVLVTDVTFNFLLQACINDKVAGFRHALLVWRKMLEKGVKPSLFSFNLLLRCSRDLGLGNLDTTKEVIQSILNSGTQHQNFMKMIKDGKDNKLNELQQVDNTPNLLTSQPHLGSVVDLKDIKLPEHRLMLMGGSTGVLQQMKNYGIRPDIKTFTQLLDQITSTNEAEEELLKELATFKLRLDIDFCNMLIKKRCLRFDYKDAKVVLKLIQLSDLRPDIVTFGVLAMTCRNAKEANRLISDIIENGFRVNMEILGTFLSNACYEQNICYVKEIMQKVKEEDLQPNAKFLEHLQKFYHLINSSIEPKSSVKERSSRQQKNYEYLDFCAYYRTWRKEVEPEVLPHPWKQFEKHTTKEDEELLNTGKLKYVNLRS